MKSVSLSVIALVAVLIALGLGAPRPAQAAFHCMRIHAVMGGALGNAGIQYVELRMPTAGQTAVSGTELRFFDASASGMPTGTFTLPGSVLNGATGASILIGTSAFASNATVTPDFTMPANVMAPAGKVQFVGAFDCAFTDMLIDSVAYGGAGYMGGVDFGSVNAASLPTTGAQALTLNNLNLTPTNNATEYALATAAPRNNAGTVGSISSGDSDGDTVPDSTDNCPSVPNGPNEAAVPGVGNQTNTDADSLGDACDPDDDNDGIADEIDPQRTVVSTSFSDQPGGTTFGQVLATGGLSLSLTEEPNPAGVRVQASGGVGTAQVAVCGLLTLNITASDNAVVTCGSATVNVFMGPVAAVFGGIGAGLATGAQATVQETATDVFQISNLPASTGSVTVEATTIAPGGNLVVCSGNNDCDSDSVPDGGDNCRTVANGPAQAAVPGVGDQLNTDVTLGLAGATVAGVPIGDGVGDACDRDIDDDSFTGVTALAQTPGAAATACPGGSVPVWADCLESYLGTDADDNCNGAPGTGTDAWPPDVNGSKTISAGDVFAIFPSWLTATPRHDLDASGTVSGGDVFKVFPWWLISCT